MVRILSCGDQLKKMFAGLIENTFHTELGLADPHLVDYLTDMLLRFVKHDQIFKYRDLSGQRMEEVVQMVIEAEQCQERPRRELHRHIGDFTLFWNGVYPEALKHLKSHDRQDHLIDYREQGKRSYYIASTFEQEPYRDEAVVLRKLSEFYDVCSKGLYRVRQEWELN